jgi:hypothetical protein
VLVLAFVLSFLVALAVGAAAFLLGAATQRAQGETPVVPVLEQGSATAG